MTPSLDGPRAKLARAEYQLDSLSEESAEFMETNVYTVSAELNPVDDSYSVYLEEVGKVPTERWGLALGEIVHNCRGSLDHLVAQLVRIAGRVPHNRHQFPIVKSESDWDRLVNPPKDCKGRRRDGYLDFIAASHIATIKLAQPYTPTTGKPSLSTLQRFSNADKHRLIHVAATWITEAPEITIKMVFPLAIKRIEHHPPGTPLGKRTEIARAWPSLWIDPEADDKEMDVYADLKLTTVFGEPGKEDTRLSIFRACINDARAIIESFASSFT